MSEPRRLRLFVALQLPDEWRGWLAGEARSLESAAPGFGRWVEPSLMHVTLLFLGGQDANLVPAIQNAVGGATGSSRAFSLQLASPGSFGGRRSLRVIWIGVDDRPSGALRGLHAAVAGQLQAAGIGFDAAPFRAHITLGRARRDTTSAQSEAMYNAIARRAAASGNSLPVGPVKCEQLTLMRSDLRPTGPIYTALHHAKLGR